MKHLITITTLLLVGILACGFADTASATIAFPEKSPGKITFIGDAGSPNVFTVNTWKFTRVENPDRPENIGITAMLDVASITCDWKDLEKNVLKKKEYFHSKKWKTASITIDGATLQRDGSYLAEAQLELKGIRKEIPISFTIGGGDNNGDAPELEVFG